MNSKLKNILIGTILTIILITFFYFSTFVSERNVEQITVALGFLGPVAIAIVILLTQIFAPFSGTVGMFIGFKLYGYGFTMIIFYIVSMISAAINFHISRKYGRKIVARFIGESNLKTIDELILEDQIKVLIGSRIFGYYFFDFISYAFGLTNINFKKYCIYTVVCTLLPITIQYFAFRKLDFGNFTNIIFYYLSILIFSTILTAFFLRKYRKKVKNGKV